MIIDFHTHSFPDELADRAVSKLAYNANIPYFRDGKVSSLKETMDKYSIDYSVLMPVVTKPSQISSINRLAIEINNKASETGILSFGGIHPDCEDYKDILRSLKNNGIKGIKLHPVYQRNDVNNKNTLRVIDEAYNNDLIVLIHSGLDVGIPGGVCATVDKLSDMLKQVPPSKLVLAHMGGWNLWDDVLELIAGQYDIYLDTAVCLIDNDDSRFLSKEKFKKIVEIHGADKILFGTDSPWSDQLEAMKLIKETIKDKKVTDKILGANAQRLLNIKNNI